MTQSTLHDLARRLRSATSPDAIEHDELQRACLAGECHVIDVREPHEHAAGHLPEAINHPLSRFDPATLPDDKPIVLVCQAGGRSAKALKMAHDAGRTDVIHYIPGTGGWSQRGGRIVR